MGVAQWTAAKARALRWDALRESQQVFAERARVAVPTVQKWEKGWDSNGARELRGVQAVRALDAIYGELDTDPDARCRFWQALDGDTMLPAVPQPLTVPGLGSLEESILDDEMREWLAVNRRQVVTLMGALGATLPTVAALLAPLDPDERDRMTRVIVSPERTDDTAVAEVEAALDVALAQNDRYGPQAVLAAVKSQHAITEGLLHSAPDRMRPKLFQLHGHLAQVAGWMSFDMNDFDDAEHYYEVARRSAHKAKNLDLVILVLCNLSYLETWRGNSGIGIEHAMAARHWSRNTHDRLLKGYAETTAAVALAATRDPECLTALDTAADAIADVGPVTAQESLAYFAGEGLLSSINAGCLLRVNRKDEALRAAQRSLNLIDSGHVRNRALAYLDLANVYAAQGDVEQAALAIADSALLAGSCRSDRLLETVSAARQRLDDWKNARPVAELDEQLYHFRMGNAVT